MLIAPGELGNERLAERGERKHLIEGGRHIADAKFQRRKERMRVAIGKIVEISSTID